MNRIMTEKQEFLESLTVFQRPKHFFTLIVNQAGSYLGIDPSGDLGFFPYADDNVMWKTTDSGLEHVVTKTEVVQKPDGIQPLEIPQPNNQFKTGPCRLATGPECLPSEYLEFFRKNGWVCLNSILTDDIVEGLEKVACTDRFDKHKFNTSTAPLSQSPYMAKAATEPVSLWVIRQYMQTEEIRLAHTPSLAILDRDDGRRNVQGWHSDYPYLWGITGNSKDGWVPTASGSTVLGVQRNVCVSDFTKLGWATAFKLGYHVQETAPPESWGRGSRYFKPGARKQHGLPYSGPEADIIEAPGGSIILYDARTWHRAGINRQGKKRAAMLQAIIPMYVMPYGDTSVPYKKFANSKAHEELTELEKYEFQKLMVHTISNPAGTSAITIDSELTATIKTK